MNSDRWMKWFLIFTLLLVLASTALVLSGFHNPRFGDDDRKVLCQSVLQDTTNSDIIDYCKGVGVEKEE